MISHKFKILATLALAAITLTAVTFGAYPVILSLVGLGLITVSAILTGFGSKERRKKNDRWLIDANALQDAIFITDLNGKVVGANKACKQLTLANKIADTAATLLEPLQSQAIDPQSAADVLNAVLSAPDIKFTDRLTLTDGRVIERTTRPIEGTNQRIWILRDVTQASVASSDSAMHQTMLEEDAARTAELAEQLFHAKAELENKQTELTKLANTDPLTGIWNRRRFLALAEKAISDASETKPLWVLMMDIDHFKRVNDTYGHAAGDVAIRDFSKLIKETIADAGFVGRMGGEEFAAILTNCAVDEAYRLAERIRKQTTQMQTAAGAEVFRFTTSMGVAAWLPGEPSIEPALDRADKALYSAKTYGRNRVVGYE